MIVMALDHANLFIAHGHPRPEFWSGSFPSYSDPLAFFTRAITHLAAPGFFFLMGAGMTLFAVSRRRAGWSDGKIARNLIVRGVILIGMQFVLEDPAWIWGSGGPFTLWDMPVYLGVLYGLGGAMILGTLLLSLDLRLVLAVSVALISGTEIVLGNFARELSGVGLARLLVMPGTTREFTVYYPILPWLGVTAFGIAFGRMLAQNAEIAYRRALIVGAAFLALFIPLRVLGGFGNLRPPAGRDLIAFLSVVKYPPSLTFLLLTLGIDLSLLFVLSRRALSLVTGHLSPLLVFGATPLFFYIAHLYLYGFIGRTFFPQGTGIPGMYPWWLAGLAVLYPLCWLYGKFKAKQPHDSIWRFF